MTTKLITPPQYEPVTLAQAKLQCRVEPAVTDDDALIALLISTARQRAEHELMRSLMRQTWEVALDDWGDGIELAYPPVLAIDSVKYIDTAGTEQTLAANQYSLDRDREPGWLVPAYGVTWPAVLDTPNAVRVRYRAGYSDDASETTQQAAVPAAIKHWILIQVASLYAHREQIVAGVSIAELPTRFVAGLLDRYRIYSLR